MIATAEPKIAAQMEDSLTIGKNPGPRGGYRLYARTFLPYAIEDVFDFFSDAHNLQEITPPWLNFVVLTPKPIDMHSGALIEYKLRLRGVPIRWRTEILDWEPPHKFIDTQIKGPYRLWHHEHRFTEMNSGTLMEDEVIYKPLGGALVNTFFVARDVKRIFSYRAETLKGVLRERLG